MDEFLSVLAANPQADMPLGKWETRDSFFRFVFNNNLDVLVDRETGTADFDNDYFVRLLESMSFLPEVIDEGGDIPDRPELIGRGRQIMDIIALTNIDMYQVYRRLYGGDIVFKGFPSGSGSGNLLTVYDNIAMTVTCSDKDGAWEFIRLIVTEDWQRRNFNRLPRDSSFFPVSKVVFDEMIEEAMKEPEGERKIGGWLDLEMDSLPLTQEEADHIRSLISGEAWNTEVDPGLWNIVSEEASRYFHGQITAQEAARVIQSRASIFMSEQYG
jgi:ABC-type glycerol-3-phosphate transport system substrate-binding protein